MSTWSSGYVSEIDYTYGYYRELSPVWLRLCLLSKLQHSRTGEPLRYLELGFGQGLSLNIHAASVPGEYWGTDINPVHAAGAAEMAAAAGSNLRVLDSSFEELAARDDLPEFDVITLHGIWSWISDANRRTIVDIAKRRLAVGGILYISYNSTPGWSAAMPLRHLMTLHAELASGEAQGVVSKVEAALGFAQSVVDAKARYFAANPAVAEQLKRISEQNRHYLAHEYFNADWLPMPFSDVATYLDKAKLSFAASANILDHIENLNVNPEQQKLLELLQHPVLRESVRDYLINQRFRKDIWIKGGRGLSPVQHTRLLRTQSFVLITPAADIPLKVQGGIGEADLQAEIFTPTVEALASRDYTPKTFMQIFEILQKTAPALNQAQLAQALIVLSGAGHVSPVQPDTQRVTAQKTTEKLNNYLMERAGYSGDINYLASPVVGGGIGATRVQQLFLRAIAEGKQNAPDAAQDAWNTIKSQGGRMVKDGNPLESEDDNRAEMTKQATEFFEKGLPIFKAVGIAAA
jgi:hypothetical protein